MVRNILFPEIISSNYFRIYFQTYFDLTVDITFILKKIYISKKLW